MKNLIVGIGLSLLLIVTVTPAVHAGAVYHVIPAASDFVGIKIVAKVTSVSDSHNLLGGAIQVDDTLTGKYVYGSEAFDNEPNPNIGLYLYSSTPCGIEVKIGDFVFKTDSSHVHVAFAIFNDFTIYGYPPIDEYVIGSLNNLPLSNGLLVTYIDWDLYDSTATALSSTDVPTSAPVLSDWDEDNSMLIEGKSPSNPDQTYRITAQVTKATKPIAIDIHGDDSNLATLNVKIPTSFEITNPFLHWIFERFPHAFPVLRFLLGH